MRPSAPLAAMLLIAVTAAARAAPLFLDILPPGQDGLVPASTVTAGAHATARRDDIHFAVGGALVVGPMPWQNRPTFQQVVQIRP